MSKLESIVEGIKTVGKAVLVVSALYLPMEAHYNFPRNVDALLRHDKSTPSAMFRTEEVAGKALNYQCKIFDKYLGE